VPLWLRFAPLYFHNHLTLFGCCRASDDFDQLASDDGLTSPVKENLELVDHITGILRSVLHDKSQSVLHLGLLHFALVGSLHPWHFSGLTARKHGLPQEPKTASLLEHIPSG
jgi:hypothetical protein